VPETMASGLRGSQDSLTTVQKSAEGIVAQAVGEASEALQCRKAESTDRPNRKRWVKAGTVLPRGSKWSGK